MFSFRRETQKEKDHREKMLVYTEKERITGYEKQTHHQTARNRQWIFARERLHITGVDPEHN